MTNSLYEKAVLAGAALNLFPPLIRDSLLNDKGLMEKYGLTAEPIIVLGENEASFKQSKLFNAIRAVLAHEVSIQVTDVEDQNWSIDNEAQQGELPKIALSFAKRRLILPDFSVLSPDASTRIRFLEASAADVHLPRLAQEEWRQILEQRALEDYEVEVFQEDIRDTPEHVARTIGNEIKNGGSSISTLVPHSRRYYERLVGIYDGSGSIGVYAIGAARSFLETLLEMKPYEGFLYSLFVSSHSALTSEIKTDSLTPDALETAFEYLSKNGDLISCLGALEVGFRILPDRPEIEPILLPLVYRIRDAQNQADEFNLLSSLFILVDGELARTCLFAREPPFYRRLASLAQAALIHRQMIHCKLDYQDFAAWAVNNRIINYYMQSLADMRMEPRWNPDLIDAQQMKADFFGRIIIAGNNHKQNLGEEQLREIILGDGVQSLPQLCDSLSPFFPGPLEGAEDTQNTLPDEISAFIKGELDCNEIEASSFLALVNSAMIFRISTSQAELAAKALRMGNHTLINAKDKSQLVGILNGLATVAAISRSSELADELRILVRRYRRDAQYTLSAQESMRIYLVAAAARKDMTDWTKYAGECLTELAFSDLKNSEVELLHSSLTALLHSVPELWRACARAEAALEACCN